MDLMEMPLTDALLLRELQLFLTFLTLVDKKGENYIESILLSQFLLGRLKLLMFLARVF